MNKFSKFLKHGKRLVAIMLVLFMNINSFADVGANDGTTFVTKAEFDSVVKIFNEEFDAYQMGMNAKIDSAISRYLASLSSESTGVLASNLNSYAERDRKWWNNSEDEGGPTTGDIIRIQAGTFCVTSYSYYNTATTRTQYGYVRINSYQKDNGAVNYTLETRDADDKMWKVRYKQVEKNGNTYLATNVSNYLTEPVVRILRYGVTVGRNWASTDPVLPSTTTWTTDLDERVPGIYNKGVISLWGSNPDTTAFTATYFNAGSTSWSSLSCLPGSDFNDASKNKLYYGIVWDNRYKFDSNAKRTIDLKGTTGGARIAKADGGNEQRQTDVFTYKTYTQKVYSAKQSQWVNESATKFHDDVVYQHNGVPLFTNDRIGEIKFTLNLTNTQGKSFVAVKNKRWGTAGPDAGKASDDVYYNDDASGEIDITFNQENANITTYWLKVCPVLSNETSTVNLVGEVKITYE